jgi:hypothetical protein
LIDEGLISAAKCLSPVLVTSISRLGRGIVLDFGIGSDILKHCQLIVFTPSLRCGSSVYKDVEALNLFIVTNNPLVQGEFSVFGFRFLISSILVFKQILLGSIDKVYIRYNLVLKFFYYPWGFVASFVFDAVFWFFSSFPHSLDLFLVLGYQKNGS